MTEKNISASQPNNALREKARIQIQPNNGSYEQNHELGNIGYNTNLVCLIY